jgi:hypothetical protein
MSRPTGRSRGVEEITEQKLFAVHQGDDGCEDQVQAGKFYMPTLLQHEHWSS